MKKIITASFIGFLVGCIFFGNIYNKVQFFKSRGLLKIIKFDGNRKHVWDKDFQIVNVTSSKDSTIQKAYIYDSRRFSPLVVSLHTWSGDYSQRDDLAPICKNNRINYIHPDFRGPNNSTHACCSELALSDIDDAITFAKMNLKVDTNNIYMVGVSGGGYAGLMSFIKSKHKIKKLSVWVPITDLTAWYHDNTIIGGSYLKDILKCTDSDNNMLNKEIAIEKSPLYQITPAEKFSTSKVAIYAGIFDGIQGSVPFTHSINMYNKFLVDMGIKDSTKFVSFTEKFHLLEYRKPLNNYGSICNRPICLKKSVDNLQLGIFEGGHEMLTDHAFKELLAF